MGSNNTIDFVVPWVDNNDSEWIKSYNYYHPGKTISDRGRFRDWDIFRYWFRAVERYAPWVNKVYLVTNGTFPKWINPDCEKLVLIKHSDYIPEKYLPTFNSITIELNMDKIPGLGETFVYFNDDVFLNAPRRPEDYFCKGLPCDNNAETLFPNPMYDSVNRFSTKISHFCNMGVLNRHFDRSETVRHALKKWYGPHLWNKSLVPNLLLTGQENFEFFRWRHWEKPMLKSVIKEIWKKEPNLMDESCSRFRKEVTLNPDLFRFWQFASNKFYPIKWNTGKSINISSNSMKEICRTLEDGKIKSLCLNDSPYCTDEDAEQLANVLKKAFEKKFPNESMFEK